MNAATAARLRWYPATAASGFIAGVFAAFLSLVLSGHTYRLGLPEWIFWTPLATIPLAAFVALTIKVRNVRITDRLIGAALYGVLAFTGAFAIAVLIAQADHA